MLACFTDGRGYALGSVEGRVAMEYIDQSPEAQANKCEHNGDDDDILKRSLHYAVMIMHTYW